MDILQKSGDVGTLLWGTSPRVVIPSWASLCLHSLTNPTHIVSRLGLDAHQASSDAVVSRGPLLWQAPRFYIVTTLTLRCTRNWPRWCASNLRLHELARSSGNHQCTEPKAQWRNLHDTRDPAERGNAISEGLGALHPENSGTGRSGWNGCMGCSYSWDGPYRHGLLGWSPRTGWD